MNVLPLTLALGLALSATHPAAAATESFQDLSVTVSGQGRPVVMIPGLNSAASVWDQTCQALQPVECHQVQLPGFAGASPIKTEHFLAAMRDRLEAYIATRHLDKPVLMGHSLGGVLALMVASDKPALPSRLVIVDSLPFFAGIRNPAATAESVKPQAEGMRAGMLAAPADQYQAQIKGTVVGLTNRKEQVDTLVRWGQSSDRATTAGAMYDMMTTDLRPSLKAITAPTLVLGSWAAYAPYGSTLDSTRGIFAAQYANLNGVRIAMSQAGYHFLMWDDLPWLKQEVTAFLAEGKN